MAKLLDSIGNQCADEIALAVALGQIPGWRVLRKFGRNDDVDGNEEVWELGSTRVLPTSAATLSVSSDSTADDADPAGTGAWTIQVEGLDADYVEISETITLNGTSTVTGALSFIRVNRAFVLTGGTSDSNEGNISISIGGDVQAYIEADEGQTHQTHYTVPDNHSLIVTGYSLTMGRGNADMVIEGQIKVATPNAMWRSITAIDLVTGTTYVPSPNQPYTVLPGRTDLRQKIIYSGSNAEVGSVISGFLVHNNYF